MKLLLATKNEGKILELKKLLEHAKIEVISLNDLKDAAPDIIEDGKTFTENARKKALAIAQWAKMPSLADDSGLVVNALGGEPGVHSSRYAGEEGDSDANMALLLERMMKLTGEDRKAYFHCVICLASPDGRTWETEGRVDGMISTERRGSSGFGYDPIFFYPQSAMTFAEMPPIIKNMVSHRFQALKAMASKLPIIEKELEK